MVIEDLDYQECCRIIGRLEDFESDVLGSLLVSIVTNFPEVRGFLINEFGDIDGECVF